MKKILFAAFITTCSLQTYACTSTAEAPPPPPDVTDIKPGSTTQQQAEEKLGEPNTIQNDGNKQRWMYSSQSNHILLVWDKTTKQLLEYTYSAKAAANDIDNDLFCKLNAGTSKTEDVLTLLGNPSEYRTTENNQLLMYRYKNTMLRLNFKDDLLLNMDISIKAKS